MKLAFLCGASVAAVTIAGLGASQAMAQTTGAATAARARARATVTVIASGARRRSSGCRWPSRPSRPSSAMSLASRPPSSSATSRRACPTSRRRPRLHPRHRAQHGQPGDQVRRRDLLQRHLLRRERDDRPTARQLFISQIEVDRGPQNTLHGSNADGGTINYISQRPTKTFYAEGRVGAQLQRVVRRGRGFGPDHRLAALPRRRKLRRAKRRLLQEPRRQA